MVAYFLDYTSTTQPASKLPNYQTSQSSTQQLSSSSPHIHHNLPCKLNNHLYKYVAKPGAPISDDKKPCVTWAETGNCPRGDRCRFEHHTNLDPTSSHQKVHPDFVVPNELGTSYARCLHRQHQVSESLNTTARAALTPHSATRLAATQAARILALNAAGSVAAKTHSPASSQGRAQSTTSSGG